MCTPMTMTSLQAGASLAGGVGSMLSHNAQAKQLEAEAAGERDTGRAQAERILKATRRERGAARAAIGASGVALDEFALENERYIQDAGELDASMAILSGERRARQTKAQASYTRQAGFMGLLGGAARAAGVYYNGWKGAKGPALPDMNHED